GHPVARGDLPEAVVLGPEQGGEARRCIETRQAEPVDRSVRADQGDGVGVTDQRVVLDAQSHEVSEPRAEAPVAQGSPPTQDSRPMGPGPGEVADPPTKDSGARLIPRPLRTPDPA